jgi:hypothetical protein
LAHYDTTDIRYDIDRIYDKSAVLNIDILGLPMISLSYQPY